MGGPYKGRNGGSNQKWDSRGGGKGRSDGPSSTSSQRWGSSTQPSPSPSSVPHGGKGSRGSDRGYQQPQQQQARAQVQQKQPPPQQNRARQGGHKGDSRFEEDRYDTYNHSAPSRSHPSATRPSGPQQQPQQQHGPKNPPPTAVTTSSTTKPEEKNDKPARLNLRADEAAQMTTKIFAAYEVSRPLKDSLMHEGIRNPLPIQDKCLQLGLRDYDVYAMAKAGSGKTLAWAILSINRILQAASRTNASTSGVGPIVLALVPSNPAEPAMVLSRLSPSEVKVASLSSELDAKKAYGADVLVTTPKVAATLLSDGTLGFGRTSLLVVDGASDISDASVSSDLWPIVSELHGKGRHRGRAVQIVAFSANMTSPADKLLLSAVRKDRVMYHSVLKRLPDTVGNDYSFLRLPSRNAKLDILPKLIEVPGMDKVVILAYKNDLPDIWKAIKGVEGTRLMWDDVRDVRQQEDVLRELQSLETLKFVAAVDEDCFRELDLHPEAHEAAMYVMFDSTTATTVLESRTPTYARRCRIFMTTLITERDVPDIHALQRSLSLPEATVDCDPITTSVSHILLEDDTLAEPPPARPHSTREKEREEAGSGRRGGGKKQENGGRGERRKVEKEEPRGEYREWKEDERWEEEREYGKKGGGRRRGAERYGGDEYARDARPAGNSKVEWKQEHEYFGEREGPSRGWGDRGGSSKGGKGYADEWKHGGSKGAKDEPWHDDDRRRGKGSVYDDDWRPSGSKGSMVRDEPPPRGGKGAKGRDELRTDRPPQQSGGRGAPPKEMERYNARFRHAEAGGYKGGKMRGGDAQPQKVSVKVAR